MLIANTGLWCGYNLIFDQGKNVELKVHEEGISLARFLYILLLKSGYNIYAERDVNHVSES